MNREAPFQDRIIDLIQEVIRDRRFDGVEIIKVERGYPVDGREVDIALFLRGGLPFLFIETKRKSEGRKDREKFDVFSPAVVGQAISYIALLKKNGVKCPFFATARPGSIAVFRTPENIEEFVDYIWIRERKYEKVLFPGKLQELLSKYLVVREPLQLSEEFFQGLLDTLAKDYSKTKTTKVELSFALIEQFRNFVEDISESCKSLIKYRMENDSILKQELEKLEKEVGYTHTPESLAKMMAYVLMNKLIFYKILEKKYKLPILVNLNSLSSTKFLEQLNSYFDRAIRDTEDFEPIFRTGVYDMISFPDENETLERVNDFIAFLDSVDIESIGELIGYIYEELIPPDERHALGQFYTPPPICELITKWAIRDPEDKVLDPGVGSGGFIIQAYKRLLKLKTGRERAGIEVHKKILEQLYAIDINPFPAHLTAMNLSMKNVRAPSTNMNIIVRDFFQINPKQIILSPYKIKTAAGEFKRKITIPEVEVVVGNPPYTRWDEIPNLTKKTIIKALKNVITEYKLLGGFGGGLRVAQNPGIYIFWIIHATKFLKEGGRLGMIISNLWLQTDYGTRFSNFLLDNYKIKAVIDFSQKLFAIPMISTLVLLMERCNDEKERLNNNVHFMYVKRETTVDDLLKIISKGEKSEGIYVKTIKQSALPRDKTWIQFFTFSYEELKKYYTKDFIVKADKIFDISRGNVTWFMKNLAGSGADPFFYLTPSRIIAHDLKEYIGIYILPALTSSKYSKYFTFTKEDWEQLKNRDRECYMFICHKLLEELPPKIRDYINWGSTECRVSEKRGSGALCSETIASKQRERTKGFCGWYDLGEVVETPIFAIYQAWYKTRFTLCKFPVAMYHGLVTLIPKPEVSLTNEQVKALLAYLNSSFIQYYIEIHGRRSGGGIIALEVNMAREMPIIDVRKLSNKHVKVLAEKFDELETEARRIGGASEKEHIEKLKPKIYEIDVEVGRILDVPEDIIRQVQESVEALIERRISSAKEIAPETVKGEEPFKMRQKKDIKREEKVDKTLMEFF